MTRKIYNSNLETTGSLTSGSVDCRGTLEANTTVSNNGYLTADKLDSATSLFDMHTPSVYARKELVAGTPDLGAYGYIQSFDTIPAVFHDVVGVNTASGQYSHSAVVLKSYLDSEATTQADYYQTPAVDIRCVSLHSDSAQNLSSIGVKLVAQVGPWPLGPTSYYTSLHVRPDKVRVFGPMQVTGGVTTFTGAHLFPVTQETLESLTTGMCLVRGSDGFVVPSSAPGSSMVVGIFIEAVVLAPDSEQSQGDKNSYGEHSQNTAMVASVGDARVGACQGFNVCNENGDIQPGDLLVTSSTPGYLMKQDDDIMRSKTVGKAMEAVTFDANGQATGVYGFIYCG